jgi:hypothetical protein
VRLSICRFGLHQAIHTKNVLSQPCPLSIVTNVRPSHFTVQLSERTFTDVK